MNQIIILTKKWGRDFTGATLATQCLVKYWIKNVEKITVFTLQSGEYESYPNQLVYLCSSEIELRKKIRKYIKKANNEEIVFYSDDHLGFIFGDIGVGYYHTYHGNWPDARYVNWEYFLKSFYFIPLYRKTIRNAKCVVNVSRYMEKFTKKYNQYSVVINNGIEIKEQYEGKKYKNTFLMVGNVDSRKYGLAVKIAEYLSNNDSNISIHIYGNLLDKNTVNSLQKQKNIVLMGAKKDIPYKAYNGLINTSRIENLSISVCEALLNEIPVFCFAVGGLPEVVLNGVNGCVLQKYEVENMGRAILDYNAGLLKLDMDNSRLVEFNWEIAAKKYLDVFCADKRM